MQIQNTIAAARPSAVIERAELAGAFAKLTTVVEKRPHLPILATARVVAHGEFARLSATDLDTEIHIDIPAAIDARFSLCLDAHKFADLLKKAPAADMVAFEAPEADDEKMAADFERIRYSLPVLPSADFPDISQDMVAAKVFELDGRTFRDSLAAVEGAISTEETRFYLNGVFIHRPDWTADGSAQLVMVATDGHRLYRQTITAPEGTEGMPGVILPRKLVGVLLKLWKGKAAPETVRLRVTGERIELTWQGVRIVARPIDGTFPDYTRVIPMHNDNVAEFSAAAMLEAIKGLAAISPERGRAVRIEAAEGEPLRLSMIDPENGTAETTLAAVYTGAPIEIGFRASQLAEILAEVGEPARAAMSDASGPVVITGDRPGWTGVLMPMRV